MPHVLLIESSPDAGSRSRRMARHAAQILRGQEVDHSLLDLRDRPDDAALAAALAAATHLVFATPIYNFDVSAATKEIVERVPGAALENKTVGFLCAAGGPRAYMGILSFANALMLDFRCWIVPRFVYATGADFDGDAPTEDLDRRIGLLLEDLLSR